ncbi:MAG TPA: DUF5715 family protein [Terriglobales bacterium]|nr:DUF5715 family protein [Terriglobales bacterium]
MNRATRSNLVIVLLFAFISLPAQALHYHTRHSQHFRRVRRSRRSRVYRRHRHIVWLPVLLHGSHNSLVRQNEEIDRLGLPRIADDQELYELEQSHQLVPIRESRILTIHPELAEQDRFCKSWTLDFLHDLAQAHFSTFHTPIQVNSAVRTVAQQKRLRRYNHNAAPVSGDTESSHVAGLTVDVSRRGMGRSERKWMEQYLLNLKQQGLIETAEERREPVFHIMVAKRYEDWRLVHIEHRAPEGQQSADDQEIAAPAVQ